MRMVNLGNELLRISPKNPQSLEFSRDGGRIWQTRMVGGNAIGDFTELMYTGSELLGRTSKGLYVSTTGGRNWQRRGW
ncbi:MAG: hypothetical protein FWB78_10375 [Treponema sp.]|nr:hypothetical protein [Treponema sp.]